jgi:GNAT superfamily N-acetyltransferase
MIAATTLTVRSARAETDYGRIAALYSAVWPEPPTAGQLLEWDRVGPAGEIRHRLVAEDGRGTIVGQVIALHRPWMEPGRSFVWVAVDVTMRRQGIGSRLSREALARLGPDRTVTLDSEVMEDDAESLAFAQKHGFAVDRHMYESRLDLAKFDETPYAGGIQAAEATGIRFRSLADLGDTPEARRRLYEVNRLTGLDIPGWAGDFAAFEDFSRMVFEASWYRPAGQILAFDGDEAIGLAAVAYFEETQSAYNNMTGVLPAYRGRGIAQALKLLAIRFARSCGAAYLRANNDSQNLPMLAINRKLGYIPRRGYYRLVARPAPAATP